MLNKKLEQKGEEGSENYQAGGNITINNGITYLDARQIALDVFKANFLEMSQAAALLARNRAEELTDKFLSKLINRFPDSISTIQDPDIQFSLFDAQKGYARSGSKELENLLTEILLERTQVDATSLHRVKLNEAIAIAPKLTTEQLNSLSLIYLIKSYYDPEITAIDKLVEYFETYLAPFVHNVDYKKVDFMHIVYTGCFYTSSFAQDNILRFFIGPYRGIFSRGFSLDDYIYNILGGLSDGSVYNYGEIHLKLQAYTTPSVNTQNLHQFINYNNKELYRMIEDCFMPNIHGGKPDLIDHRNDLLDATRMFIQKLEFSEDKSRERLFSRIPWLIELAGTFKNSDLFLMNLTSVGETIAIINLKMKFGDNFKATI